MVAKVLTFGSVGVALAAVFLSAQFAYFPLVLLVLGLAWGFMQPAEDVSTRVAFYVLAFTLPTIADHLDVIPVAGAYANGFLDNFAVVIAGVAIGNVFVVLMNQLKAAAA